MTRRTPNPIKKGTMGSIIVNGVKQYPTRAAYGLTKKGWKISIKYT